MEVCKRLREFSDAYILMLTARADELDRLNGLDIGADDYISKPFSPTELQARIRALFRRPHARRHCRGQPPRTSSQRAAVVQQSLLPAETVRLERIRRRRRLPALAQRWRGLLRLVPDPRRPAPDVRGRHGQGHGRGADRSHRPRRDAFRGRHPGPRRRLRLRQHDHRHGPGPVRLLRHPVPRPAGCGHREPQLCRRRPRPCAARPGGGGGPAACRPADRPVGAWTGSALARSPSCCLAPGDSLVVVSDGVLDVFDFRGGFHRKPCDKAAQSRGYRADDACGAILALAPAETAEDDVTVVVVRRLPAKGQGGIVTRFWTRLLVVLTVISGRQLRGVALDGLAELGRLVDRRSVGDRRNVQPDRRDAVRPDGVEPEDPQAAAAGARPTPRWTSSSPPTTSRWTW